MILRDIGDDEVFYRFIVPRWSHAPTSGAGAVAKGGRFDRAWKRYIFREAPKPPLQNISRMRVYYPLGHWPCFWLLDCGWLIFLPGTRRVTGTLCGLSTPVIGENSLLTRKWSQRAGYWVI